MQLLFYVAMHRLPGVSLHDSLLWPCLQVRAVTHAERDISVGCSTLANLGPCETLWTLRMMLGSAVDWRGYIKLVTLEGGLPPPDLSCWEDL